MIYNYEVIVNEKLSSGSIKARDIEEAISEIRGNFPYGKISALLPDWGKTLLFWISPENNGGISTKTASDICDRLSLFIENGLPVEQSLKFVRANLEARGVQKIIDRVLVLIEQGIPLSRAFGVAGFPREFLPVIQTGEKTGTLGQVLKKAAKSLKQMAKMRQDLRNALIMPAVNVIVMVLFGYVLFFDVLPRFHALVVQLPKLQLSAFVSDIFALDTFFVDNIKYLIGAFSIFLMIFLYVVLLSRFGKRFVAKIIRKIKFIDSIFRVLLTYKFVISFEMLIGAGFTRNDALAEIARSLGSKDLSEKVLEMKRKMEDEGIPLAQVLSGSDLFSGGFSDWIGIAADSGNLHDELIKMESVYEELVAKKLEAVKAVVSPIMVVAMSVMVLLAFAALYGPIFGIVNSFMGGA